MFEVKNKGGRPRNQYRTQTVKVWSHNLAWAKATAKSNGCTVQSLFNEAIDEIRSRYEQAGIESPVHNTELPSSNHP